MIGTKSACCQFLGLLDITGWLQKAVLTLRQKKRGSVKFTPVADPIGLKYRFATRDRKRVKSPYWALRVLIVEEWRVISVLHPLKDCKMQFQYFLHCIRKHGVARSPFGSPAISSTLPLDKR